jgi:rhodanese-related sulfurtransferase
MNAKKSTFTTLSPAEAFEKMKQGAVLVDVREYPEWNACHIAGSKWLPLGQLKSAPHSTAESPEVLLLCKSGKRSCEAARVLCDAGCADAKVVEGGIEAWRAAGLPTAKGQGGPISIERQVRIGAGTLVLLGLLVPQLRVVSYFVPCGLIFAGITDWCGMAKVLCNAPWNRPRSA